MRNELKRSQNEVSGGGGTGASSSGGGGSATPQGDSNSQAGTAQNNQTPGNINTTLTATPGNQDWRSTLPKELQEDASLKVFNDITGLAKSYISAQKLVGADKIPVPSKHATDEDWRGVYHKLGLPQDVKEYAVKFKDGTQIDPKFVDGFKDQAYKSGILPKQAQALADWFSQANGEAETSVLEDFKKDQVNRTNDLRKEWGSAFEQKALAAQSVVTEIADEDMVKYLNDSGLASEPRLIKLLAGIHDKYMKESTEVGGRSNKEPVMTPKDAQGEINKVMSQVGTHPYFLKDHPGHKDALAEMQHLFKMVNPSKSPVDMRT
jgi:hypothetical protein